MEWNTHKGDDWWCDQYRACCNGQDFEIYGYPVDVDINAFNAMVTRAIAQFSDCSITIRYSDKSNGLIEAIRRDVVKYTWHDDPKTITVNKSAF